MNHVHVLWTRPKVFGRADGAEADIVLADFEALTWLVSILEIARHSPIGLVTDARGRRFVEKTGLAPLYHGGISTVLDDVPADIHPKLFWNAGKLFAWTSLPAGSLMVDTDAILWQPLQPTADVLALHPESARWSIYAKNRGRFAGFGLADADWDWTTDALNTALWYFRSADHASACATRVLDFMRDYSAALAADRVPGHRKGPVTVFAGQHLPAMWVRRAGLSTETPCELRPDFPQLKRNDLCSHLWLSKDHYRVCAPARHAFTAFLLQRVQQHGGAGAELITRWKVGQPPTAEYAAPDALPEKLRARLRVVRTAISGGWIRDAHCPALRPAIAGAWMFPGEEIIQRAARST